MLILRRTPTHYQKLVNLELYFMPPSITKNPVLIIIAVVFGLLLLWPVLHNLSSENDFDLFVMSAQRWKMQDAYLLLLALANKTGR